LEQGRQGIAQSDHGTEVTGGHSPAVDARLVPQADVHEVDGEGLADVGLDARRPYRTV
jgi:hypothetical protein